ncbi:hypothetical protein AB0M43_14760 [Longispora sp. NPDC051575]|uniref:hypothetical protein n=1 Tax=Longispora sp. NPDC051575 TaxID=3154943 RepID=UPI00343F58A9
MAQAVYPLKLRFRAVQMYAEIRLDYRSDWATLTAVAERLGIKSTEAVRLWVRKAEAESGNLTPTTPADLDWRRRLRKENDELRRVNEALKIAIAEFVADRRNSPTNLAAGVAESQLPAGEFM